MKNNLKKRILSMVLAVTMAVSVLPAATVAAFAEELPETTPEIAQTTPVPSSTPDGEKDTEATPTPSATPDSEKETEATPTPSATPDDEKGAEATPTPSATPDGEKETEATPTPSSTPDGEKDEEIAEPTPAPSPTVSQTEKQQADDAVAAIDLGDSEPQTTKAKLQSLVVYRKNEVKTPFVAMEGDNVLHIFDADITDYIIPYTFARGTSTVTIEDRNSNDMYFNAVPADSSYKVELHYTNYNGESVVEIITRTAEDTSKLKAFPFIAAGKNEFKIVVSSEDENVESTEYKFELQALPTLVKETNKGASIACDYPVYCNAGALGTNIKSDTLYVPECAKTITINAVAHEKSAGSVIEYKTAKTVAGEETVTKSESNVIDISDAEKIYVVISKDGLSHTYTYTLERKETKYININVMTEDGEAVEDADIAVTYNKKTYVSGNTVKNDTGKGYPFIVTNSSSNKFTYTFNVSKDNYKPTTVKAVIATNGDITVGTTKIEPDENGNITIDVKLSKAPAETLDPDIPVSWKNFRNSDVNMAITDIATPKGKVSLKWNKGMGDSWANSPSVPIIVDNSIVVMASEQVTVGEVKKNVPKLYKLDAQTGQTVLDEGGNEIVADMRAAPSWGYTPPIYAKGMIICPLSGGTIQAFNAKTLEPLWYYTDPDGGQANTPITYSDGYIYTGFWNGESADANYVCINIEDKFAGEEAKTAEWKLTHKGGFYWAGAVAVGDAVIFGSDDGGLEGDNKCSYIYSLNKITGEIISKTALAGDAGDQRSSITYDETTGRIYFTTKGGYLYSAKVESNGGISDLKCKDYNEQMTSTPVVYSGKVYFGKGSGIQLGGSTGSFAVADANTLEKLFEVEMKGYPQSSALLSTAYENEGWLYFYMTYNSRPGGISLIKVKTDATTAADAQLVEIYDAKGFDEYSIASVVCGDDGTLYYRNDSGNFIAVAAATANTVDNLIEKIGTVTLESKSAIEAAREAYEALSESEKTKVTKLEMLVAAEKELENFVKADEVDKLIADIGYVTLNNGKRVKAAREAYNKLTDYQKTLVKNYETLLKLEEDYKKLAEEAVGKVEKLIDKIGEVDLDSAEDIAAARLAYNQLSDELKALVENYDKLKAAEVKLEKLREEALALLEEGKLVLTKTELLELKEDFENVTEETGYDAVLELLRTFYKLGEKQQLALENSDAVKLAQKIVAKYNHTNAFTGVKADGLEWNIRIAVEETDNETALNDIKTKLENSEILTIWDIYLEDVLTNKKHTLEEAVQIKMPISLLGDYAAYDYLKVLHYTDDGRIELLNCEEADGYIMFNAADFSWYGVVGFMNGEEEAISENLTADAPLLISPQSETNTSADSGWIIWAVIAAVGVAALIVLMAMKKRTADEE